MLFRSVLVGVPGMYRFLNRVWNLVQEFVVADTSPSSARVHSSLTSPPEMSRERSAGTSALRERSTASVGGDDVSADTSLSDPSSSTDSSELLRLTHLTIKKVTRDIEDEKFNTAD